MKPVFYNKLNIGSHISFHNNEINRTIRESINTGMYSLQFFMGNPLKAWNRAKIEKDDLEKSNQLLNKFPMNIFTHYPYCANLAGNAKGDLGWSGNLEVDDKLNGLIKSLEYELGVVAQLQNNNKNSGVVIHPGSHPNRIEGHKKVAETINKINFPKNSILILENSAGEGNKLCKTLEEIKCVIDLLEEDIKVHVKVCIDTAHIWGQGDFDLRKISEIDRLFEVVSDNIGIDNFHLLHLNDSKVKLGAKRDCHACIGTGHIWGQDTDSLCHLLKKCNNYEIPIVVETNWKIDNRTLLNI